jgi:hypothetical protein
MPAIDTVMKKLGFVRLSQFGLVLTPEGRVISLRPAVLDDGFGGRIVGWQEGDLAAAELERWEARRPAAPPAVATRVAAVGTTPPPLPPRLPAAAVTTRPAPVVPAVAAAPVAVPREHVEAISARASVVQASVVARAEAPVVAKVAAEPVVEEDDWEWTIAIARARAAAEEVELSVEAARAPTPQRRTRSNTVPPSVEHSKPRETPTVVAAKPAPLAASAIDYNDYTSPTSEVARVVRAQPSTVIPIPRMPTAANTSPRSSSMGPVVRPSLPSIMNLPTPIAPSSPRRFAKGTGPIMPTSATMQPSDDTVPSITLPPAVTAVALPSVKRA